MKHSYFAVQRNIGYISFHMPDFALDDRYRARGDTSGAPYQVPVQTQSERRHKWCPLPGSRTDTEREETRVVPPTRFPYRYRARGDTSGAPYQVPVQIQSERRHEWCPLPGSCTNSSPVGCCFISSKTL